MSASVAAHLNFAGTAREALDFYASVFGGEVEAHTYAEFGMPADLPGADRIVFGAVTAPGGFRVAAYDIPGATTSPLDGGSTHREDGVTITDRPFFLAADAASLDEATGYWEGLSAGAEVIEPLAASAWSAGFGMLADRFGVTWVISVAAPVA